MRSLLDNEPYKHEPGKGNHPEFNAFVQYTTWKCLLLDYLSREADPAAKSWLHTFVHKNGQEMLRDVARQHAENAKRTQFTCPYKGARAQADYPNLIRALQALVSEVQPKPHETPGPQPLAAPGSSRPENVTLKRKCEPEMDDVAPSPDRIQRQKQNQVVMPPNTTAREPGKERAKPAEVIDLT